MFLRAPRAALVALLFASCPLLAGPVDAPAQVTLTKTVMGGGAVASSAVDHRLRGTVGEAVVGQASSAPYSTGQGFWAGHHVLATVDLPAAGEPSPTPSVHRLRANHPNPFRSATTFEFSIARETRVTLRIFDVNGRRVATVLDAIQPPGNHRVDWDGRDDAGQRIASGVYFYRLSVGDWTRTRQLVNLR